MNTAELSQSTESQLMEKANDFLSQVDDAGGLDKPHLLIRGQFYLDEIARRQQTRQNREERVLNYFELVLTIIIVVMIGKELRDGAQQARLLDAMNENSLKQITLIGSLIEQQKSVLDTVGQTSQTARQQLNLFAKQLGILTEQERARFASPKLRWVVASQLGIVGEAAAGVMSTEGPQAALPYYFAGPTSTDFRVTVENIGWIPAESLKLYVRGEKRNQKSRGIPHPSWLRSILSVQFQRHTLGTQTARWLGNVRFRRKMLGSVGHGTVHGRRTPVFAVAELPSKPPTPSSTTSTLKGGSRTSLRRHQMGICLAPIRIKKST